MGNQENIPGECVSGFIPATNTHTTQTLIFRSSFITMRLPLYKDDLLSVTSLYRVVSK